MTSFADREKEFEARFKHDQEFRFKATARRNRLLGMWAAQQMGLASADAEAYAKEVVVAAQRDCYAGRTSARRSADTVNIVFGNVRQLEVDDVRYAFHIYPSRGNVGSDEDPAAAGAKAGECALALGLRLVSMNGDRLDAGRAQMPH